MKNFIYCLLVLIITACSPSPSPNNNTDQNDELTLQDVVLSSPNIGTWVPREAMKSRNGESMGYGVFLNPNSDKLLIFLDGGGACYNSITCAFNPDSFSENDFYNRLNSEQSLLINRTSDNNQFKDWNFVFVPYATGDVHSSNQVSVNVPNGGALNQTMVGFNNFTIILNDLKTYFDNHGGLSEIVFTGSSAGGFGTLANTIQLVEILAEGIPTTVIDDAGQIFSDETILTPCLAESWEDLWKLSSFLPSDVDDIVTGTYPNDVGKAYEYLSVRFPTINFALLSYYEDSVNRQYYSFGQNNCFYPPLSFSISGQVFKLGLLSLKDDVLNNLENWHVFYANGTNHTFLDDPNFNQTVNGVTLNDWILQLREGVAEDLIE